MRLRIGVSNDDVLLKRPSYIFKVYMSVRCCMLNNYTAAYLRHNASIECSKIISKGKQLKNIQHYGQVT